MFPMTSGYAPPHKLDATKIVAGLHQGSAPLSAQAVRSAGFRTLVFCAQEIQPPDQALADYGIETLRCPIDDNGHDLPSDHQRLVQLIAAKVARRVQNGRACLVTCAQGRNRSGLVVALALHQLMGGGKSGREIVRYIQSRRANALTNQAFVRMIEGLR